MTASLQSIRKFLDEFLRIDEAPDAPHALNGLQVENRGTVGSIVAAVDATQATIDGVVASLSGSDAEGPPLLVVHHGLFWDGNLPVTERRYRRLKALIDHDIALYAAHIPLDVHPEVGNNAVLGRRLGLTSVEPFGDYRGIAIGVSGNLATHRAALMEKVDKLLGGSSVLVPGGPEETNRLAVVTGAAGNLIHAAREAGCDTFLTGEGNHHTYFDAMEYGVNLIFAGHYATEHLGVRALAEHLAAHFDLPWEFHDHPTGM